MNALESLRQFTTVVADTGSFESMRAYQPQDATTNPTLIIRALDQPAYAGLLTTTKAKTAGQPTAVQARAVLVAFGQEILSIIPGRVSTEVDARLSFDTQATIAEANEIMALYAAHGIAADRVLIKIAATWEGIRAAEILERSGIHCNLTLIFSPIQAAACAEAGVTLISPFVGRISDWHKKQGSTWASADQDPGVLSVKSIFNYLKSHGFSTEVMGASFRSIDQVMALAGCDLLTVSPDLLEGLKNLTLDQPLVQQLNAALPDRRLVGDRQSYSESTFRFQLNEDVMATEKLAEGIRAFVADSRKLDARLM
jgi:transaldolase